MSTNDIESKVKEITAKLQGLNISDIKNDIESKVKDIVTGLQGLNMSDVKNDIALKVKDITSKLQELNITDDQNNIQSKLEKVTSDLKRLFTDENTGVESKVKKIAAKQLGIEEAEISLDASFVDDLNADSLDLVELMMAFEEEFDCLISDDVAEKIKTISDAIEHIKKTTA